MKEHIKELMHQSLEGTLSKSGRRELEEALRDPEVRKYYEKLKKAEEIIEKGFAWKMKYGMREMEGDPTQEEIEEDFRRLREMGDGELRRKVKELEERFNAQRSRRMIIAWSAAAAVIIVGMVVGWMVLNPSPERLYAKYYGSQQFYIMRSEADLPADYYLALDYYTTGKYAESVEVSGKLVEKEPGKLEYRFLYALALQGNGEMDRAMEQYRILLDRGKENEMIYPLSAWYLGLCYLHEGDKELANRYLGIAEEAGGLWIDGERVRRLRKRL